MARRPDGPPRATRAANAPTIPSRPTPSPAGRRPPLPLVLALSLSRAVVHNPRVDRAGAERGATAVAYAVMVAIIALLLVGGVFVLSGSIESALSGGAECVASPTSCDGGSGGGGGGGGGGVGGSGGGATTTTLGPTPAT
jgi:Flp pilus assembly pilin Flp